MKTTRIQIFCILPFLCFVLNSKIIAQDVPITFEVNMSYQIEKGNFVQANDFVDIAGSFNSWGGTLTMLDDTDMDSIYTVKVNGFTPGNTIEYKFRINGSWADDSSEFPGGGSNRVYTVKKDSNFVSVWYNDEFTQFGSPAAGFYTSTTNVYTGSIVQFRNQSSGNITSFKWIFEGGSPSESAEREPAVRYFDEGSFDVWLITANEDESDTLLLEDYITVAEREENSEPEWWNNSVFYELFVRSFYDSDGDGIGDFNGIIEKLDYLNDGNPDTDTDLGITGIWLMPINPSPSYHGYNVTDYRAINPDYGTMQDFKNFLNEAHARGIRVIIDYVMNHTSDQHPWFQKSASGDTNYRDFYRWSSTKPDYLGPWGQEVWHQRNGAYYYGVFWGGMPDLNYENPSVRDSMFAISDYWIKDIGVDGFRQDAVLYIDEDSDTLKNTPETFQFWHDFNSNLKAANPDAFAVGEAWDATEIALKYISNGRLDYAFEFDLAQSIINGIKNEDASPILSQMQKVYDNYPFLQYGTFLTNHDQDRIMTNLGNNNNDLENVTNKAKLAASLYLTLPGVPYLYYGEEVGMLGQKPDEDIRLPMQWSDEANAGFTTGNPWREPNSNFADFNVEKMESDKNSLLNLYKDLIHFREKDWNLRNGEYEAGITSDDRLFIFVRGEPGHSPYTLVAINLSSEPIMNAFADFSNTFFSYGSSTVGWGGWLEYGLESDDNNEYRAPYPENGQGQRIENINIAPYSIEIIKFENLLTSLEDEEKPSSFSLHQNYPNPFNPTTSISFYLPKSEHVTLNVYDITGRLVSTLLTGKMDLGEHSISFDAKNLSSGIYFYTIKAGEFQSTRKMTLIK